MPYRDGWGWFTGYLAVTCMENPWYFFAAIAGSWLASVSSRRGWQKSQQSQQKTSKSWSGRCFVYNGGLVIFCIYTFCFFLTSSSLAEFCHGGWTDESSWSTFDRINRTEALFFWEGKSVGPSCRTAELYQLISQMFDIYDHIYVLYTDPSGLRYILHEYKIFTVYLYIGWFFTNTVLFTCASHQIIGLQLLPVKICTVTRAMQTDTISQLFKSRVDSHATHDIDII